ncbi:uncharacterized protein LOC104906555 [Beta vulgaris subsp. vulgaris]|uniref:uncharacterized protein LOC104906555 n=1 Tax=Beta vulgaris subsp. vulgaris TaxID=3555 RepID=UPI002546A165|nr:uncharacterized protein LOC104906555 [Beta vulgaris subsp. vulgaris]
MCHHQVKSHRGPNPLSVENIWDSEVGIPNRTGAKATSSEVHEILTVTDNHNVTTPPAWTSLIWKCKGAPELIPQEVDQPFLPPPEVPEGIEEEQQEEEEEEGDEDTPPPSYEFDRDDDEDDDEVEDEPRAQRSRVQEDHFSEETSNGEDHFLSSWR